jgi:hypothetical protein
VAGTSKGEQEERRGDNDNDPQAKRWCSLHSSPLPC